MLGHQALSLSSFHPLLLYVYVATSRRERKACVLGLVSSHFISSLSCQSFLLFQLHVDGRFERW
jgi:hypothetical protein